MTVRKPFNPDWSVHPGEVVREARGERRLTIRAAAVELGIAASFLCDIEKGRRAVGPKMALRLERLGWGSASMFARMQADHDLHLARLSDPA